MMESFPLVNTEHNRESKGRQPYLVPVLTCVIVVFHALCLAAVWLSPGPERKPDDWMGWNWKTIKDWTLMNLTVPGAHNTGIHGGLHTGYATCAVDYRYEEYKKTVGNKSALDKADFDMYFIPWNVNQIGPMAVQLASGARWFHMKLCSFNAAGVEHLDLRRVLFTHRGYTTHESLGEMLDLMLVFLRECPKEVVVLNLNHLYNKDRGVSQADFEALSEAVLQKVTLYGMKSVRRQDLETATLEELVEAGRRVAIFSKGATAEGPEGILPTGELLSERWDDVMESGDIAGSNAWLIKELKTQAVLRGRYYVMQANPNDSEPNMYRLLGSDDPSTPKSLREWEKPFLVNLESLILDTMNETPGIMINAISTDLFDLSKPYEIAMKLNGLPQK